MMYIEHFVLLAGAYNLGFFIELAEYFIFFIFFKLLCVYKDGKQYNLTPPARVWDLTTPGILNDITDRLPT